MYLKTKDKIQREEKPSRLHDASVFLLVLSLTYSLWNSDHFLNENKKVKCEGAKSSSSNHTAN